MNKQRLAFLKLLLEPKTMAKLETGTASPGYKNVLRAASPDYQYICRAASPDYQNVNRATSSDY